MKKPDLFDLCLFAFCAVCLSASIALTARHPGTDSPGWMPLICSGVMVLCSGLQLFAGEAKMSGSYRTGKVEFLIALGLTAGLCAALLAGLPFYISAFVFLVVLNGCLNGGQWGKSLLYSVLILAVVYLIFTLGLDIRFD